MENPLDLPTPPVDKPDPKIPRPNDLTGRTLGDFQLIRRIGQGGMGQVYLARQISLKRQVAVKILRTDLAANITALKRFQHEAEAVARITHANIVQVYAIGESDGLNYMALEYVEGRNLRDYIHRKGPPEVPLAVNIMRQVASALQRASELGFVHRDIKPENILLTRKGEVKVADFGLSRCFAADQPLNITQSGVTMGTPLYMSPEQVQGHNVGPRSDIYSFGVTCYHMFAGEPPFRGQTPFEVALQHVQSEATPLQQVRPDLPPDLCAIVHKMMAKKPEERYQTAREILRDLMRMKEGLTTSAVQTALAQSGGSGSAFPLRSSDVGSGPLSMGDTQPMPTHPMRWKRWVLIVLVFLIAGSVGAAIHWQVNPSGNGKTPVTTDDEPGPELARTQEKDLLRKLNDRETRSDIEATNALLELTMLYLHEKRPDDALALYDSDHLRKRAALAEAQKSFPPTQYFSLLNSLGRGIVLAYRDQPNESNFEFKKQMVQAVPLKSKASRQAVDTFLWKYDPWKRMVADSLERNVKNLGIPRLDDQLNRYRSYSSKAP